MSTLKDALKEHPFTRGLPEPDLERLASMAVARSFEPGELLLREGDPAETLHLIRHGRVALELHSHGQGNHILQTLTDGDVLGLSWMSRPFRWRFDARASERTRTLALDARALREACEQDPRLAAQVYRQACLQLTTRLESARLQLLDLYSNPLSRSS